VVAVSPLLETSQQPGSQVHVRPGRSGRGRGGEGSAGQGGTFRGGLQEQLQRVMPAHEHPHEDEKERRRVAESLLAVMGEE
jgi:hypothetical protein